MKYYLAYRDTWDSINTNFYFFYSDIDKYGIATIKGANSYTKKEAKRVLKEEAPKYDYNFITELNWKIVNPITALFYHIYDYLYNEYLNIKLGF